MFQGLKGLEGVVEMKSTSQDGRAQITLEFGVGVNLDRALLLLANRLDRVDGYPEEADEPIIATSGTEDNPIAWFILKRVPGNERPVHTYRDFIDIDTLPHGLFARPDWRDTFVHLYSFSKVFSLTGFRTGAGISCMCVTWRRGRRSSRRCCGWRRIPARRTILTS